MLQRVCVNFLVDNFDVLPLARFIQTPEPLLAKALNTGRLVLDESVIFDRLIRWGYAKLGRPAPQATIDINISRDPELARTLAPLLPPRVLLTRRNKVKAANSWFVPFLSQQEVVSS